VHHFQASFSGPSWTPDSFIENYIAKLKSYPLDFCTFQDNQIIFLFM
jgi:hypothetical protein